MAKLVAGSLKVASEALGPLGSAVGFVVDLVVDQISMWEKNRFEASTLRLFLEQTMGHMQLLRGLAALLAGVQDRADISKVIGNFSTPRRGENLATLGVRVSLWIHFSHPRLNVHCFCITEAGTV